LLQNTNSNTPNIHTLRAPADVSVTWTQHNTENMQNENMNNSANLITFSSHVNGDPEFVNI